MMYGKNIHRELRVPARELPQAIPDVYDGFARHGATIDEAIGVAILMDGGPGTVHGPRALEAFREFHDDLTRSAEAA